MNVDEDDELQLYTRPEVAETLKVSEGWLVTNRDRLPCIRFGRSVRYSREDIQEISRLRREWTQKKRAVDGWGWKSLP